MEDKIITKKWQTAETFKKSFPVSVSLLYCFNLAMPFKEFSQRKMVCYFSDRQRM
jgi:hypothetical protein